MLFLQRSNGVISWLGLDPTDAAANLTDFPGSLSKRDIFCFTMFFYDAPFERE
jgi:hypothetical protein